MEELNWRPRIVAVKNVFNSWRQRGPSFRGKSLIVNALALARIWYVASLVHLPAWALRELVSLVFSFFWKGKPDLVARKVVCQPTSLGGFGVVSIELKACALLVQWIRRLVTKPASWVHFFYYYCWHRFGCSPLDVLSHPSSLDLSLLPPFYNSLLAAWQKVNGGFSNRSGTLVICTSGGLFQQDLSLVSTKLVYSYLLSAAHVTPHCVEKFVPQFGLCIGLVLGGNSFSSILIARSLTWPGKLLMVFCILRAGLFPSATWSPWFAFVVLLMRLWFTCSSIALLPSPSSPGFNH